MRHLKSGRKLKRTSSHRKALLKNLASSLFEHKKVLTTEAKAKELRPYAESLITKAKHALSNEKGGLLPEGQKVDIHNRRIVGKHIRSKAVLQELFDTIAPMVETRQGGYTRIIKTGFRRGDAGRTALIELVDWSAPQDGATSKKSKRKATTKSKAVKAETSKATKAVKETASSAHVEKTVVEKEITPAPVVEIPEVITETPVAEAPEIIAEAPVAEEIVSEETSAPAEPEITDEEKKDEN